MRLLRFIPFLLLSSALADQITVTVTGLPSGLGGTALVGNTSVPLGGTTTVPAGTYTVTPRAVAVGGWVYVAQPVKVKVKGQIVAKVNYSRLPAGSADPFFGKNGVQQTTVRGLETYDNWNVRMSAPGLPIVSSAGSFQTMKAVLLTTSGALFGPSVKLPPTATDGIMVPSALLKDAEGYLGAFSYLTGTIVRFDSRGQVDGKWRTSPMQGIYSRGLLRLPDGGLLAYGGATLPALWRLKADGTSVNEFGANGIRELTGMDQFERGVTRARLLDSGVIRLVLTYNNLVQVMEVNKEWQITPFGAAFTLPNTAVSPVIHIDGTVYLFSEDVTGDTAQLIRLAPNGQLDKTWNSPVIRGIQSTAGLALQQDGKLVAAYQQSDSETLVMRFLREGGIDTSFGKDGRVILTMQGRTQGMQIGTDGKIYLVQAGLAQALTPDSAYIRIIRLLTE